MEKWKLFTPILLFFGCFLAVILVCFGASPEEPSHSLLFYDTANQLTLAPYYDEKEDTYFLFLPACTRASDLQVSGSASLEFSDGDRDYGSRLADLPLEQDLAMTVRSAAGTEELTFQLWQCTELPSLFLHTKPDALTLIHSDKSIRQDSQITLLDSGGQTLLREVGTLSGRGNGTWTNQAKRPYNLGFSNPVSFGPFQDLTDLCLFAEFSDASKMRNDLALYAARELAFPYAAPYCYTNLYVNGEYLGLYGLTTKAEYKKHIDSDGIQAVFELSSTEGPNSFRSGFFGQPLDVLYGSKALAETLVNQFESALIQEDWDRCGETMDLEALAKKFALDEFFCNIDMTYASQYYYVGKDNIIRPMLPWDYDFSLYSAIFYFNNKQSHSVMAHRDPFGYSWYPALLEMEPFRLAAADALETCFTDELFSSLESRMTQTIAAISVSRDCDIRRWRNAPQYNTTLHRTGPRTLPEFYTLFSGFFPERRAFLEDYLRHYGDYCRVTFTGVWYGNLCIPRGSDLGDYLEGANFLDWSLPGFAFTGWRTASGLAPEDIGAVTEDLAFTATFLDLTAGQE